MSKDIPEYVQEILTEINELTNEEDMLWWELAQVASSNEEIEAPMPVPDNISVPPTNSAKEPKLALPDIFHGDRTELHAFLLH